ncbi:MAG TPA: TetR/AcrR family transcriptional regulator [Solirubrobacterales bacterium]|nr:TetR/AcrR family transcriptional regulator [Solirubrobacterales bacterium]
MTGDELFRTTLPPGRHKLPRDFVQQHQRARLFAALVELVDEKGYPAVSLTQIVKRASVARHTFYEHYEDKEALFLALFDQETELALRVTAEAMEKESGSWEAKVRTGLAALLELMAGDPARARVVLIESQSAGPEALARRAVAWEKFAEMLRTGRDDDPRKADPPGPLEEILLGGAAWMINKQLVAEGARIEDLLPQLLEYLIAPYRGNEAARALVREVVDERPARDGDGG